MSAALTAEARQTTRRVARTFALACRLLPRGLRDDVYLLYLVLRTLDDLVDEHDPRATEAVAAVETWAARGETGSREARILADLATRHDLPRHALRDFCLGMRDDLDRREFATEDEVDLYCYRVAGTVGVTMCSLLGVRGDRAEAERAAKALGMAMQRTNILRDIDEDRANGRIFLARATIERFGGLPSAIEPGHRAALMREQIARADALYDAGCAGVAHLEHGRRAVSAAAHMYREILRQIEREGYGERPGRAVVAKRRKIAIAARSGALAR